jgi:hypothetical protein
VLRERGWLTPLIEADLRHSSAIGSGAVLHCHLM